MNFKNANELLALCEDSRCPISEVMLRRECSEGETDRDTVISKMERAVEIMKHSTRSAIIDPHKSMGGLIGGEARLISSYANSGISACGGIMARGIAYAMGVLEVNAEMGLIVAAPTAGSSGVVPGVLFLAASTEQEPAALIAALGVVFIGAGVYLWVFKALQYSQVFYLLLEEPELSVVAAVKKSRAIMAGRKRELLFLHITFIPWYLTVTFTAGFSLVFILPYVLLTLAGYHDMLMEKDDHAPVFILQKDKQPEPTKSKNKGNKKGKRK